MARVLIVEDDPPIRGLLDEFLGGEGFDTLLAIDGRAGVELARRELPDLILIDIMLPVLDGLSAIRLLRADRATRDLRIVAMSAHSTLLRSPESLPADAFLTKPFDLDVLLGVVVAQTSYRTARRSAPAGRLQSN
jgi:DNA-binding response OmpR family regulator